jgi:hypothetical protein
VPCVRGELGAAEAAVCRGADAWVTQGYPRGAAMGDSTGARRVLTAYSMQLGEAHGSRWVRAWLDTNSFRVWSAAHTPSSEVYALETLKP